MTKVQQENQALKDKLEVIPSAFGHFLPDMNSTRGLQHELKSKGWWNSIVFFKTTPLMEGELKPNYSNSSKLML